MRPERREKGRTPTMSTYWRIVNPTLDPAQVVAETDDEQGILREFVTRNARANGYQLVKSEDDAKTWVEVEARAPDAVPARSAPSAPAAEKPAAEKPDIDIERPRHESSKKTSR